MKKPTMLMILDGFGCSPAKYGNAIFNANKPNLDKLFSQYPHTLLGASGLDVGLPEGQMGNSEVGHLNIGAGRIVYQELTKITKSIKEGPFFENPVLNKAIDNVKNNNSSLHLLGLLSDGGVHSHMLHLNAIIELAIKKSVDKVYIHAFLDGRDVTPRSALKYVEVLEDYLHQAGVGQIASISGRYYAMDRDNRWERVQLAYDAMTLGIGQTADTAVAAIENAYNREENDEFVKPTVILSGNKPIALVEENDSMIMFNFRPDRAREITRSFVDHGFGGFERSKAFSKIHYVCFTQYDADMPNVEVAFPPQSLKNTLGEYLSDLGLHQLRIAETEKYAHVTFFFNGGVEEPNPNEDRILIPSPKVATYDLKPEMSAYEVADKVVEEINAEKYDVIILNFANPDMVGHTGIIPAAVNAIETVDTCVGKVVKAIRSKQGNLLLTADHGNADKMLDETGNPVTAHSTNKVPFMIISDQNIALRDDGILADIAPSMLQLMNIPVPKEMTGRTLIISK